jgi:hypothetical protein
MTAGTKVPITFSCSRSDTVDGVTDVPINVLNNGQVQPGEVEADLPLTNLDFSLGLGKYQSDMFKVSK